jgi:hypothetical protein
MTGLPQKQQRIDLVEDAKIVCDVEVVIYEGRLKDVVVQGRTQQPVKA